MKIFRLFSMAALTLMMAACSNDDNVLEPTNAAETGKLHFTATIAAPGSGAGTRTVYEEITSGANIGKINVKWKEGDEIAVINLTDGKLDKVTVQSVNDDGSAVISGDITKPAADDTKVTLYYPYSKVSINNTSGNWSFDADPTVLISGDGTLDGTLESIADNADLRMVSDVPLAISGDKATLSSNVKLETGISIWKLTLQDASNNAVNATLLSVKYRSLTFKVKPASATNVLYVPVIDIGTPSGAAEVTITATTASGDYYNYSKTGVSLTAGNYCQSTVTMADPLATPLTIEALTAGTIVIQSPRVGMQYSLNGGTKTAAPTTDNINLAVQAGDKVQLYGNGTEISTYNGTRIQGEGTGFTCKVYGNIMSLIDETGFATKKTLAISNVFRELFYANNALKDASGLLLPAETLTSSCYQSMFQDCSNLVTGPDLPAMTLQGNCYYQMFFGCSSLTAAPDLPATTLKNNCYYGMFNGCSSLTAAPDLPAPELVSNCYRQMFQNCYKLASVKCLATNPTTAVPNNWLKDAGSQVTGTKYFYAVSGVSWNENSDSGIPAGWTRVNIDN